MIRLVPLLSVSLLGVPTLVHAQTCFRGRPLPTCRTFWITEYGFGRRLTRHATGATDGLLGTLEVGLMRNRGNHTALGATLLVGVGDQLADGQDMMLGFKARYRRWLSPKASVEFSPGVFYTVTGGDVGMTAHAALNLGDWAALTGQVLASPKAADPTRRTDVGWYAGVKLGSFSTIVGAVATSLVLVVFSIYPPG